MTIGRVLAAVALIAMFGASMGSPARAIGGLGGSVGGGGDSTTGTGGTGTTDTTGGGGGGGGAGQIGGQGGGGPTPGGAGGLSPGANGQDGASSNTMFGGGGGGGGGAHGQVVSGPGTLGPATGGTGGAGGSGSGVNSAGGGGGAGGWGTVVTAAGSFTNAGAIAGGSGGVGGFGTGTPTDHTSWGGSGGLGLFFSSGNRSLMNSGTITGGNGGAEGTGAGGGGQGGGGGSGLFFSSGSTSLVNSGTIAGGNGGAIGILFDEPGAGGTGIVGGSGGFTIVNSGTIRGGMSGDGTAQANAITFSGGGANSLTLQAGSLISGNVVAFSGGSDVLALGGSASATFDVSQIGPGAQYQNFANFQKTGSSIWTLTGTTTATTPWTINAGTLNVSADAALGASSGLVFGGGTLQWGATFASARTITLNTGGGTFDTNGNAATLGGTIGGTGGLTKIGAGTLTLTGVNAYTGGTALNGGTLSVSSDANLGSAGGSLSFGGGSLQLGAGLSSARAITLNTGGGTFDTNGFTGTLSGAIGGSGGLTKSGAGTLNLSNASNNYTGGTTVNGGILQGDVTTLQGNIVNNAQVVFNHLGGLGTYAGNMSGTGSVTVSGLASIAITFSGINSYTGGTTLSGNTGLQGTTASVQGDIVNNSFVNFNQSTNGTYSGNMSGTGSLGIFGTGTVTMSGVNSAGGGTAVNSGGLLVNGSLTSNTTVNSGGLLGGSGTITGNVSVGAGGTIQPGDSFVTLNITGTYTQAAGSTYAPSVNGAGQHDLINVTGPAILNGGTVAVQASNGSYGRTTQYTILTASGGVTGTYAAVTSNLAFLTPTLSYDANDVFLSLLSSSNGFANGGVTGNQKAVGRALDFANPGATGDFGTVLNILASLDTTQGPKALDAIGGQNYSGFSTVAVQTAQAFMTSFAQQAGGAIGGGHVALAEACDVTCDATQPSRWGAWGGGVGSFGTVAGDGSSFGTTYNLAGFAGGLDYRFDPKFLAGVTVGYSDATLYTQGLPGQGNSSTVQMGLYGKFTEGEVYVDGLAGYAHADNRMTRQIIFPGVFRTASGVTGANQFFGQLETGYRVELGGAAEAFLTPFARLQGSTNTQDAFSETGANSLDLDVAQQTTNSLRTVFGAQLGGGIDAGWHDKLNMVFRLGWSHEFADTARPVSAAFVGAPAFAFTTLGAAAPRDGATVGFTAGTAVAAATSLYLHYDGEIEGGNTSHVFSAGLRMTW